MRLFIIFAPNENGRKTPLITKEMMRWNNIPMQAGALLGYLVRARHHKGHGIHSPFVLQFITSVLRDKTWYDAYRITEDFRKSLLQNKTRISVTNLGAGSRAGNSHIRSISAIARHASVNSKFGQLLCRIAMHYKPERIAELGTSLGISTHYLALGNPEALVLTVEADPVLAAVAFENLHNHHVTNVHLINDTFDNALPALITESTCKTLVFIDGNHSMVSTLKYADYFFSKLSGCSILIFDDINWSTGMKRAWKEICRDKWALFFWREIFLRRIIQ
jgi:predicted O-methyltransferase YrrM